MGGSVVAVAAAAAIVGGWDAAAAAAAVEDVVVEGGGGCGIIMGDDARLGGEKYVPRALTSWAARSSCCRSIPTVLIPAP